MKTKGKKKTGTEAVDSDNTTARSEATEAPASAPAPENVTPKERFQLSFDLKEDGSPDLSAMRDKTRERARQFFTDPRIAEAFGVSPVAPATPSVDFFPIAPGEKYSPIIGSMYSTLGMIETFLAERFGKIPGPIAARVFTYSEEEKQALAPLTGKVLNKWAPAWMIKYQDEIALANLLISVTFAKCVMATALTRQMQGTPPASAPAPNGEEKPAAKTN